MLIEVKKVTMAWGMRRLIEKNVKDQRVDETKTT